MMDFIKNQIPKLRSWVREKPKTAKPLIGVLCLVLVLIISIVLALTMQDEKEVVQQANRPVAQITITKDGFVPATLVVKKGTKIVWTNADEASRQIQANPHPTGESLPGLKSEILNDTQTYEYIADISGTFGYHDKLTPTTNGTIEIKD